MDFFQGENSFGIFFWENSFFGILGEKKSIFWLFFLGGKPHLFAITSFPPPAEPSLIATTHIKTPSLEEFWRCGIIFLCWNPHSCNSTINSLENWEINHSALKILLMHCMDPIRTGEKKPYFAVNICWVFKKYYFKYLLFFKKIYYFKYLLFFLKKYYFKGLGFGGENPCCALGTALLSPLEIIWIKSGFLVKMMMENALTSQMGCGTIAWRN